MRILAPLLLVALCLGIGLSDQSGQQPTPFRKDNVYVFQYNSQISSGLSAPNDEDSADPQQNSAVRIRAQAKITFASDRHGQLQLEQIRIGQLNEQLSEPEKVQPMAIFEPKQIPEEKQRQLELPVQFHYDEGVVERVQFQNEDDVWSKNVKRAVLNMIQLNLKRNNAQGLRTGEEQQEGEDEESQSSEGGQLPELGRTFNIPEITLEGVCQTTYAINKAGQRQQGEQQETTAFNVTKTINFKQCTKIADLGYGFQTEQPQPQCSQCQLYWSKNEQQNQNGQQNGQQQQHTQQHPCAKCDPKKVKEQMLDRSTVLRYQLVCPSGDCESSQKFGLKRTELLSQYVFKQAKSQTGKFNSAMQTIVAATLKFQSMEQKTESVPSMSGGKDESLMFSSEMDLDVKRFYMYGDEEFSQPESSPFHQVPKVQHAQQALRKLTQTMTGDKQTGIEVQAGFEVQRLVELLRMSRREELEEIEQNAIGNGPNGGEKDRQKARQIYTDALAICGTRNCIQKLAEKIQNKEISQVKAAQALRTLTQVPAPSEQILKIVQRLCKQENVHNQRSVKQSCWLTFGALVNELCQHKTPQKGTQKYAFEAKSALDKKDQCPQEKKEEYKQTIMDLYTSAATIYDKVLALSALGNAGIENAVGDIEQIIKDRSEACIVRCKAVDALRRLRTQMPRKIQQILLPIFQNVEERSLLRAAALAILLPTQPDSAMIDQIAFTIAKEGNRQIQAYAYQEMKNLAKSKNPVDQQIAKHMKNALRMTNVDEEQLRNSGKWQFPVYSEQVQEGVFIEFAQMVSSRSAAPAYLHAQIDSFVNDQFQAGQMKLYIAQQEAENWYQKTTSGQNAKTPTQRRSFSFGQSLRNIFSALGIKSRRNDEENNRQPFAMFALRTRDVDQAFVAIDGSSKEQQDVQLQEMMGQFLSGQSKPSLERFLSQFHQNQQQSQQQQKEEHRGVLVTNLNEQQAKIPTSAGLPLRILTTNPVLATIEGQTQLSSESARLDSPLGVQTQINVHSMASLVHIQKMEYSLPFMVAGVESVRSLELNVPMQAELNANAGQGQFSVKVKLPRKKHTLFGFHSLPFTYTAQVDTTSKLVHEPRQFRAIHHPRLERMQHEVSKNYKFPEQLGIPLHIQGHYHWPTQSGTGPQQFLQMLMATENVIHIVYQPTEETPREAIFRISGNQFQRTDGQKPQLEDFYREQIESAFESQELNNFEMEPSHLRGQKLRNFIGNYEASNQYKHSVKLVAQTVGGPNEAKAQAEVAASCDAKMQACNAQLDAQLGKLAGEKWTMKIQSSVAMPESVQSIDELAQLEQRNNKFQGKIQAEWGIGGHQKEHVNIRIQGEQARKRQNIQNNELVRNEQGKRRQLWRQAFLNKFDLEAQYQLKAQTVNHFGKMLECLKTSYYWNSQTQPNYEQMQGQNGGAKTLVSLVIDPVTQKHANISIKTPNQQIRLQQIELPIRGRPFSLVRQQQQSIHSFGQFVNRIQVQGRAECTVDGRNVNTFDNVQFNAPLSDACNTVLAKDCSSGEPKFVVLMKAQDNIDSGSRNSPKKLKVITPEKQIECEPKTTFSEGEQRQIVCKENGNEVQNNNDSESVEFNNAKKSDVNVHVPGISVRFNGRKTWLKVSSLYKNSQCGLCGHYDDSVQDEWRMSNNENTNDLAEFHRSYTLNDNQQGEQCNQQELNNFYRLNGNKIRHGQNRQNSDEVDDGNDDWMDEQFDGQLNGQNDWNENWGQQSRSGNNKRRIETPVKKTKMVELSNKICVSQKTIKQCPKGYIAIYGDGNESQEDAFDQNNNADEGKSFKFSCFNRNTAQARDILRQMRNGNNVLQFEEREHSIVEKIREPKKCVRGNY